ncbi:hypothetical protein JCM10296v2_007735 [Rhodotorula toruloides]
MEDFRKCRYEMDLVEQNIEKLERLDNPPGFAYVVWRRWECSERLELLEGQMKGMRNGRKLHELRGEQREWEDKRAFWKEREEVFVTDRKLEKQAFEMFTLIKHISDARWVIVQLRDSTVASVLNWIRKRIAAAENAFEKHYRGPHCVKEPPRSASPSSRTGHIPIVLQHRPRLPPVPEAPSQSVFESSSEDEDPDAEDFGAPLTRVSSRKPPPPSRDDSDAAERGGRSSSPPASLHRSRGHPQQRSSSRRRARNDDLPTRRPSLHRERSNVGRGSQDEHAERSIGRAGTYRMARRYFGREY